MFYFFKKYAFQMTCPTGSGGKIATGCLQLAALQLVAPEFPAPGHHRKINLPRPEQAKTIPEVKQFLPESCEGLQEEEHAISALFNWIN